MKTELEQLLRDVTAVEENQILSNHKEQRRLLLKVIFDLSKLIKSLPAEHQAVEERYRLALDEIVNPINN